MLQNSLVNREREKKWRYRQIDGYIPISLSLSTYICRERHILAERDRQRQNVLHFVTETWRLG